MSSSLLKTFYCPPDSDDLESEPDLATRMLDLDLDDEKCIWEKLTADEKKEFRKLVATGDIINIIPDREPWWKILKKNLLIQESSADKFDYKKICPALPPKIPDLATLTVSWLKQVFEVYWYQ